MHSSFRSTGLSLIALLVFAAAASAAAQSAQPTLSVDVANVKGKVSPLLYGLMTEEINYSYDGGL
ncbi:MAG TPA: hypothetical protein VGR96_01945, partial [Acidobacteriaceae bacterium]|nr:hypothetical protein [Acidobacteriaceae bacterium]